VNNEIYQIIKDKITFMDYKPGHILNEEALGKEFGVSRSPIRIIVHRLEWEGLVRIIPRTGAMVTEIDILQIKDTFTVRMEIEALIGRLSAERITEEHLDKIDKVIERCRNLPDHPDPKGLTKIDRDMRNILHDAANNAILEDISEQLWVKSARVWISLLDTRDWQREAKEMLEELIETRQALAQNKPEDVGRLRQKYLQFLNRVREKF